MTDINGLGRAVSELVPVTVSCVCGDATCVSRREPPFAVHLVPPGLASAAGIGQRRALAM
jgi:hypothetical protein